MDNFPLVSILLPNYNTKPFLTERMNSILNQSYQNWELIIADSYSTDGAWEYLSSFQAKNPKITACQIPRGIFEGWNFCIKRAKGKYIYIATSDDIMESYCLEKMVAALEDYPECDICDSVLKLIDIEGREINELSKNYIAHHWHVNFPRDCKHIRSAPHDFFLHFGGKTVYTSVTQLLIKKTLFDKTGLFDVTFGCSADYLWGIRASIHANVIFLPEKLAAWRIHDSQASATSNPIMLKQRFHMMSQMAMQAICEIDDANLRQKAKYVYKLIAFKEKLLPAKLKFKSLFLIKSFIITALTYPLMMAEFLLHTLRQYKTVDRKHRLIKSYDKMILTRINQLKLQHLIKKIE